MNHSRSGVVSHGGWRAVLPVMRLGAVAVVCLVDATTIAATDVTVAWKSDPQIPDVGARTANGSDELAGVEARIRVAMVDSGVNDTLPSIAAALARDADGAALGYDFWDLDARPFDSHPTGSGRIQRHGTQTASVLIDEAPNARLVAYRYPRPDMRRMKQLVEHAVASDVRIVGLSLGGNDRAEWAAFEVAARAHPDLLFVASAGNDGRDIDKHPVWPAALPLENMIVVTSADDFGALADGVNWGRTHVDYLIPAEHVPVLQFDGTRRFAAGSSYAVPKLVAMAARMLAIHPDWKAAELIAGIRRRFGDGAQPRYVREGLISDPLSVGEAPARQVAERLLAVQQTDKSSDTLPDGPSDQLSIKQADEQTAEPSGEQHDEPLDEPSIGVPLDALRLNDAWSEARVDDSLQRAGRILAPCKVRLDPVRIIDVEAPVRLGDLSLGGSRTLFEAVRASGPERRPTLVFARDTQMADAYDGEAFGRGNTRHRPWLADSVWLTAVIEDAGIALAHELVHVLSNSGAHDARADNLMAARTSGDNDTLDDTQCRAIRDQALANGMARRVHENP